MCVYFPTKEMVDILSISRRFFASSLSVVIVVRRIVVRTPSPRDIPDGAGDDGRRPDHGRGPHHRAGAVVGVVPPRLRRAP